MLIAGCNNGTGDEENNGVVVNDTLPYPAWVYASLDPNAFVILQWEEVPFAVDYNVWRSSIMNAADENYILLGTTGGSAYYTDEHPWKGNNYYKIQAIGETADGELVEGYKNPVFDTQCTYSFDAPRNVYVERQDGAVSIGWSAVQGANVTYSVFRSTTPGGTRERLNSGPLSVLTFTDGSPLLGWNYYYVQANSPSLGATDYSLPAGIEFLNSESDKVYVGLVAFSNDVTFTNPITNNLESVRNSISNLTRGADATALCYAVSEGMKLFDDFGLPEFDNIYIVSFTDGFDNVSGGLYGDVVQALVFDRAKADLEDLSMNNSLISYAIGFGGEPNAEYMKKLVTGIDPSEGYQKATDNNLGQVFTDMANSVLATAQNVYLETNYSIYTDEYPKFFYINVEAKQSITTYADYAIGKLGDYNMFSVVKHGSYFTFDEPVEGIRTDNNKIQIPLKNFKFMVNGSNAIVERKDVQVSLKPAGPLGYPPLEEFQVDEEDGFPDAQDVEKKIAVVLVLDCSSSLTYNTFSAVKQAANSFITTLARVK
ncbi:hypothetical protein AGMMS4957_05670 [Bacteroidia bacterium]|nr:hypothetical protein AGMMS4957_05670 [Bacteroidia bacterium]